MLLQVCERLSGDATLGEQRRRVRTSVCDGLLRAFRAALWIA